MEARAITRSRSRAPLAEDRSNASALPHVFKGVAIDDLPLPVINLLNAIGVPWPYLNEDTVSEFAALVREFRSSIEGVHTGSSAAVAAITRAHQSVSTEAMQSGWTSLTERSEEHTSELQSP